MRRSLLARRTLAIALASTAFSLAGCPAAPEPPAVTDVAPEVEDVEPSDIPSPDVGATDPTTTATDSVDGDATSSPPIGDVDTPPAVTIERPRDFLRPTLPNASLEDLKEPADPPELVTDRSAEAEDPHVLPGGTPVDDLFEGLEEKPVGEPND